MTSHAPRQPRDPSDAARLDALLVATAGGDTVAFAELYDAVAPRVHGLVVRILRDPHQSEEVTQEVLLQVWQQAATYDARRGAAMPWVMVLAHRRAVDRVRSSEARRRRESEHLDRSFQRPFDETAAVVHDSIQAEAVRTALQTLTPLQRQAIEMAYFDGHTYHEVSHLMQVPLGTAKARIRDGLLKLRRTMTASAWEPTAT